MKLFLNNYWKILSPLSILISVYIIYLNDKNNNLKQIGYTIISINIFISIFIFLSPFIFQNQKKDNQP